MRALGVILGAMLGLALGCNTLIGIDGDYVVGSAGGPAGNSAASAGGSGGSSTAASSSSSAGGGAGTGGATACPEGGDPMVDVGGFCIDATEVTRSAYAEWLARGPDPSQQEGACALNATFVPSASWPPGASDGAMPVVGVDFCDARAYCAAAGKRLCGDLRGGALDPAASGDAAASAWYHACSAGGRLDFPYGDAYSPTACNGRDYQQPDRLMEVKAATMCHGVSAPFSGIYDLSGNVAEWEDACAGSTTSTDLCVVRGGSFKSDAAGVRCDAVEMLARDASSAQVGFRCCAP